MQEAEPRADGNRDVAPGEAIAPGNYCGLRVRVCGDRAGLEWDQEKPEYLRFNRINEPDRTLWRGRGGGMLAEAERFVRLPRGHPEGVHDVWANLYAELAVAVAARRAGETLPDDLLAYPDVMDGLAGVRFVEAAITSNAGGGSWQSLTPD